ncbi:NADH-quinone oxidoreductase subunit J [Helicobacter sp. MIT 11-5569]|uniref:NADH-quinone oxidoreductase subunit J n=1 Tax=Helicobacter sp. MIT 11-5569 TaxID=1548151 RepID=UPI00051F92AF|nr:NADH-quinone oxidoreductase subunit J [Helicobacter sp. MIT 11-5569]TLD80604.1 NADH-quinone oxidoreductase subunit J [Helicobacter sp. MIT 11-5569]
MFEAIAFYFFCALTLAMFLIVVTTKNILYALSALAAGMMFVSAFFFLLGAEFLGVVQIVVYTGAVIALYAFAMMFFDSQKLENEKIENPRVLFFLSGMGALLLVLIVVAPIIAQNLTQLQAQNPIQAGIGNVQMVGYVLFTKFLIPFEIAAIMLLVAMIAGIVLAGKGMRYSLTLNEQSPKGESYDNA